MGIEGKGLRYGSIMTILEAIEYAMIFSGIIKFAFGCNP